MEEPPNQRRRSVRLLSVVCGSTRDELPGAMGDTSVSWWLPLPVRWVHRQSTHTLTLQI